VLYKWLYILGDYILGVCLWPSWHSLFGVWLGISPHETGSYWWGILWWGNGEDDHVPNGVVWWYKWSYLYVYVVGCIVEQQQQRQQRGWVRSPPCVKLYTKIRLKSRFSSTSRVKMWWCGSQYQQCDLRLKKIKRNIMGIIIRVGYRWGMEHNLRLFVYER